MTGKAVEMVLVSAGGVVLWRSNMALPLPLAFGLCTAADALYLCCLVSADCVVLLVPCMIILC